MAGNTAYAAYWPDTVRKVCLCFDIISPRLHKLFGVVLQAVAQHDVLYERAR
jgi:hypothetical protein